MALAQCFSQMQQMTPSSAITDTTPPTFGGITSLSARPNGSGRASWSAATESLSLPVRYAVYIQASTATGLFVDSNKVVETEMLSIDIFQLKDGSILQESVTYHVGVRSVDAVGNISSNLETLSFVSVGVLSDSLQDVAHSLEQSSYWSRGVFAIDDQNRIIGSLWLAFREQAVTTLLGSASYTVYDNTDTAVVGLTQSGITANGSGVFVITPVDASILDPFKNYRVAITIAHDSQAYTSYKGLTIGE